LIAVREHDQATIPSGRQADEVVGPGDFALVLLGQFGRGSNPHALS
jgi:hypothetical protein